MKLLPLEILKTFAVGDDGSRIKLAIVGWQQVFLSALVFVIVIVQLRGSREYIDFYSVAILNELGRIVATYLLDRQAFSIVSLSFFVPMLESIIQLFF